MSESAPQQRGSIIAEPTPPMTRRQWREAQERAAKAAPAGEHAKPAEPETGAQPIEPAPQTDKQLTAPELEGDAQAAEPEPENEAPAEPTAQEQLKAAYAAMLARDGKPVTTQQAPGGAAPGSFTELLSVVDDEPDESDLIAARRARNAKIWTALGILLCIGAGIAVYFALTA